MLHLSDDDLLRRLNSGEDNFTERKTANDKSDWVKTVVAFANSLPEEVPGVLFIGVRDTGEIEGHANLDSLQKTLANLMRAVYPPIPWTAKEVRRGERSALAVVVYGSSQRPHFSGHAYTRSGSETVVADEALYEEFVARRNSKASLILKWKGKSIFVWERRPSNVSHGWPGDYTIYDCNQFWVTIRRSDEKDYSMHSFPLDEVQLIFEHSADRLQLLVPYLLWA